MIKTLIAAAVAAAFALPLTSVASDSLVIAQGDTSASPKQEGANPPGQASPGAPRSSTSGMDRATGATRHTNPTGKGSAGATTHRGRFEALDKNHDGYISRDEAKDANELNTRFSELDANNDGKLSRDEYDSMHAKTSGASGATANSSMGTKKGTPDKGPGAQEPANRALGTAGSGQPEGGGTSSTTK